MSDKPTELTQADIHSVVKCLFETKIMIPKCSWCENPYYVREVGPNYICYDCEKQERAAGRPLIFTAPLRDVYFVMSDNLPITEAKDEM